jgi:hypothetical protein
VIPAGTRRSPGGNRGLDKTPIDTTSIEPNGNTGLALPPALEDRLRRIERRLDAFCPMSCGGRDACSWVCPIALPDAIDAVLSGLGASEVQR